MKRSEHQQSLIDVEHDQLIDMETNIATEAPWPSQFDNTSPLKTVNFHSYVYYNMRSPTINLPFADDFNPTLFRLVNYSSRLTIWLIGCFLLPLWDSWIKLDPLFLGWAKSAVVCLVPSHLEQLHRTSPLHCVRPSDKHGVRESFANVTFLFAKNDKEIRSTTLSLYIYILYMYMLFYSVDMCRYIIYLSLPCAYYLSS
jgi:hypothetical protein